MRNLCLGFKEGFYYSTSTSVKLKIVENSFIFPLRRHEIDKWNKTVMDLAEANDHLLDNAWR